jgi:hypothetical protein
MDRESRAEWSLRDAIIWIVDRTEDRLRERKFNLPSSLIAYKLYPSMKGEEATWGEAAESLTAALRADKLQARRIEPSGSATPITPGWWNKISLYDLNPTDQTIVLPAETVKSQFPSSPPERKSHDEIVEWCRAWIAAGKGSGMDKAWPYFKADPVHAGLSRDDVFRPAWQEAKRA